VKVAHLASHILGQMARQVPEDWKHLYGHSFNDDLYFLWTTGSMLLGTRVGDRRAQTLLRKEFRMQRRTLISTLALAGLKAREAGAAPAAQDAIPKRVFGKTGESLTIIGMAGGRLPLANDKDDARAIVRRAYELGINYFDNARVYWNGQSEEIYGDVLPRWRKQVFLTTKSVARDRKGAEADLERSLKALKTDYLDLWQIHGVAEMKEVDQIFAPGGAIEAFEAAKKAGKCRFMGFTGHHDPYVHLEMLKRYDKYDTILMPLHAADPAYLSFEKLVLPVAVPRGMGIQGMKSTANAKLLQEMSVRECLSYTLSLPVHCLAVGCTTIGQIEDDARIARSFRKLEETQMSALRERVAKLKGPALEDWKRNVENASLPAMHHDV
jgi:predicted aldo/keto reductase-like oxidoreductase